MDIGNFKTKLTKLNSRLFIKSDSAKKDGQFRFSGIYYKEPERDKISASSGDRNYAHVSQQKYLNELAAGNLDKFICGTCIDFIPEYDIIDTERSRIVAAGWRSILLRLVSLKLTTMDRARKVFSCPSLGEADFDRASFFEKLNIIRKLAGEKDAE